MSALLQQPTLDGYVDGIISLDPFTLQCRDCGETYCEGLRPAASVILSGFHFHRCEGREGIRRCPECLARAKAECSSPRCGGRR